MGVLAAAAAGREALKLPHDKGGKHQGQKRVWRVGLKFHRGDNIRISSPQNGLRLVSGIQNHETSRS